MLSVKITPEPPGDFKVYDDRRKLKTWRGQWGWGERTEVEPMPGVCPSSLLSVLAPEHTTARRVCRRRCNGKGVAGKMRRTLLM